MIADFVPAAKILVGVVVKHTPPEGAADIRMGGRAVQYPDVAHGVLLPVLLIVKCLCGEHVPIVLCDKVGLLHIRRHCRLGITARIIPCVAEVIVGVYVLQQVALFQIAHAARWPGWIQAAGRLYGSLVESVIVLALIDPDAPHENAGMVPILADHFLRISHSLLLPLLPANVLPAGDFREDQKPQLIAPVDKCMALGIMAGAHRIAAQLIFQDVRIQSLRSGRRRIAHIGPALVPVQSPYFHPVPIQPASVRLHLDPPEAKANFLCIHDIPEFQELQVQRVEPGMLRIPKPCPGHMHVEMILEALLLQPGEDLAVLSQHTGPDLAAPGSLRLQLYLQMLSVIRHDKDIPKMNFLLHLQVDRAVNASVGQIVHHIAEGRDIQSFPAVHPDHDPVCLAVPQKPRELHLKGCVSAPVDAGGFSVAVHLRLVGSALQCQRDGFSLPVSGNVQFFYVSAYHLIILLVAVAQRKHLHCVGKLNPLQLLQPLRRHAVQTSGIVLCKVPVVVDLIAHVVPPL